MKTCPSCNAVMDDGTLFCTSCGTKLDAAPAYQAPVNPAPVNPAPAYQAPANPAPAYQAPQAQGNPAPGFNPSQPQAPIGDPTDHTREFAVEDVAENKPYAMLIYICGIVWLIVAIFLKKDSAYLNFHIRQGMKIYLAETLLTLFCALLAILVFPIFVYSVLMIILIIVRIICFFNTAKGFSKEPDIVKSINFLKF